MERQRLDRALVERGLTSSRSQAANWIKLGDVTVNGKNINKTGYTVTSDDDVKLNTKQSYVSRAGLKLASVSEKLVLEFDQKIVLDVGSSTGGFTDFALQNGTKKVIAVDVGTEQMHSLLRKDVRVELYEKTDIRAVGVEKGVRLSDVPDIVVIDVSFISLRQILPHIIKNIIKSDTQIIAMVKPQFEAGKGQTSKGIIKNSRIRRQVLLDFEVWVKRYFVIKDKADSDIAGDKGNLERFYKLEPLQN